MAVVCSKCGETLLGAVNRCWRCGAPIQSVAGAEDLPPIRRAPLPESPQPESAQAESAQPESAQAESPLPESAQPESAQPESAQAESAQAESATIVAPKLVGEEGTAVSGVRAASTHAEANVQETAAASPTGSAPESLEAETISEPPGERIDPKIRHGSPFAAPAAAAAGPLRSPYWDKPAYHQHSIAFAGAIASVVLGIMSLIASFFTVGAVATAILGMGMGVWGLNSNRRGTAVFGLLLCCLSIGIAGVQGSMDLYRQIHGHGPFETPPVIIDE